MDYLTNNNCPAAKTAAETYKSKMNHIACMIQVHLRILTALHIFTLVQYSSMNTCTSKALPV